MIRIIKLTFGLNKKNGFRKTGFTDQIAGPLGLADKGFHRISRSSSADLNVHVKPSKSYLDEYNKIAEEPPQIIINMSKKEPLFSAIKKMRRPKTVSMYKQISINDLPSHKNNPETPLTQAKKEQQDAKYLLKIANHLKKNLLALIKHGFK